MTETAAKNLMQLAWDETSESDKTSGRRINCEMAGGHLVRIYTKSSLLTKPMIQMTSDGYSFEVNVGASGKLGKIRSWKHGK